MADKRFNQITRVVTSFDSNDILPIGNGTLGDGKMPKDTLLELTAQNALAGNVVTEFDPARTSDNPYKAEEKVSYEGKVYIFKVDHYGAWSSSDVDEILYNTDAAITRVPLSVGGYSMAGDYVGDIVSSATGYRGCKFNAPIGTKVYIHGASAGATYRVWATFDSEGKFVRKSNPNINGYNYPFFVTIEEGEAGIALNTAFNSASDRWFGLVSVAENMVVVFDNLKSIKSQVAENTSDIAEVKEAVDEISEETIVPIEATDNLDFTNVKTSAVYYPNFVADTTRASTIVFEVCPGTDLTFDCGTDYDFVLFSSSSPTEVTDWQDSGWKTGGSTVTCNNRYANLLVRTSSTNPAGLCANIDATALAYLSASDITYYPYNAVKNPKGIGDVKRVEKIAGSAENPFRFGSFYYYHIMKSGDAVVTPQQSLYDVDAAARLGFKVFEVNTLKVADGYLMQHGQTAKTFANNTVTDLNGDYVNGVDVSGMTIAAIKAAYRYKARYSKQRTPITELTEGLVEMKKRGMIPFFSFNVTGADEYRTKVREIFGNDYIAYQGSEDKDATMIMNWSSLNTKEAIVAYCKLRKPPYLHMPSTETISNWILANCKAWAEDPTISDAKTYFNSLSESDQKALIVYQIEWFRDLADAVHNEGFIIGWAANYSDEETNQLLMMSGWDCAASGRGVNDFEYGNLVNISADLNFDDFTHHNSIESNGVLSVPVNGNVYASGTIPVCYLGKVAMHIRFNGTLKFTTAGQGNFTLVNDGTRDMYISSIILDNSPQIWIKAVTATDIYDLSFKSSRC